MDDEHYSMHRVSLSNDLFYFFWQWETSVNKLAKTNSAYCHKVHSISLFRPWRREGAWHDHKYGREWDHPSHGREVSANGIWTHSFHVQVKSFRSWDWWKQFFKFMLPHFLCLLEKPSACLWKGNSETAYYFSILIRLICKQGWFGYLRAIYG